MNPNSNGVFYVYGFTQAGLAPPTAGAAGTAARVGSNILRGGMDEPHPPFFQRSGEVAAVLSRVSPSEFCGPTGEKNLQDLAWLAPRAWRHQVVLEQVMRLGAVLPAPFATLFSSAASLDAFMRRHGAAMDRFLERVGGQEEWSVQGFLDQARAEAQWLARPRSGEPCLSGSLPGVAYLQKQNRRIQAREELDDRLAGACGDLLRDLNPLVSEIVPRRILARQPPDPAREMVLHWALLLPSAAVPDFRGRIERANAEQNPGGLAFAVSGPWPPYSFCPLLEDEPAWEQAFLEK